ncbi:hypothetical protein FBU59_006501, partial [Linderina macrospora]
MMRPHMMRPPAPKRQGGFMSGLRELMQHISYADLVPIVGTLGTFAYHKVRNSGKHDGPKYQKPSWISTVNNAAFVYSAYDFCQPLMKNNAPSNSQPGARPGGSGGGGGGGLNWASILATAIGAARPQMHGGFYPYPQPDKSTQALHHIIGSLFKKGKSRGVATNDNDPITLDDFDGSCAIDKRTAEYYHSMLFSPQADMSKATVQMMGGAAAIQSLLSEGQVQEALKKAMREGQANKLPKDLRPDQALLGIALSESDQLMQRKSAVVRLSPDDTLINIAKITIATVIQIKMDEEKAAGQGPVASHGRQEGEAHGGQKKKPQRRHSTTEQTPHHYGYSATTGQ